MRKTVQGVLMIFFMFAVSLAYADSPMIQNPGNGHWYQRFDTSMIWHDAKSYCKNLGGHLATITAQQENDFVYGNLGSVSPQWCWLGATDEVVEGDWRWVTSEPWQYTNWAGGEPNNCGGIEDYLMYFTPGDPRQGSWNDLGTGYNASGAPGGCGCGGCINEWYPMSTICEWDNVCVQPPSGMIGWWPGDGNTDEIVGARNGSIVGTAGFAPGMVADAFSFDGNGWIAVADDPIWTLGTEDFTIDLWVRFNSLSGRDPFIAHDNGDGEQNKWIFWYDSSGHDKQQGVPALRFHINSPHPTPVPYPHDTVVAPWNPLLGQWYHVAVTRSGISYALYIDGAQVATDTSTFSIPDPSEPLTIGRAEGYFLNGLIDEVEMVKRALSPEEIQAIFLAGSAGKCKFLTVTIDIKPGSFPNSINLGSGGNVPVAILSTPTFDATAVDPLSITLAGASVQLRGKGTPMASFEDVNGDGLLDLVVHITTQALQLSESDVDAILFGKTFSGMTIRGADSVRIVP